VRRDTGEKISLKDKDIKKIGSILKDIQSNLIKKADEYFKKNMHEARNFSELKNVLENKGGLVKVEWCGKKECAEDMKDKTSGGVIRGAIFGKEDNPKGICVNCGSKSKETVYVGKQY
jgi:prolyl-tRNA synthetase